MPLIARPGEQITVVAYRNSGLCGPTALHLDAALIPHQVQASAPPSTGGFVELYLTLTIPPTTSPGSHRLTLIGPVTGSQQVCSAATHPSIQSSLAEAEVIVVPDNAVPAR